jgi:hypothetical protein
MLARELLNMARGTASIVPDGVHLNTRNIQDVLKIGQLGVLRRASTLPTVEITPHRDRQPCDD